MRARLILLSACGLLSGCLHHAYDPPGNDLERALYFVESDRGERVLHSGETVFEGRPPAATRVPAPALVDLDSTIHIYIDPGQLGGEDRSESLDGALERVRAAREEAREFIDMIESVVDKRAAAIDAYRAGTADFTQVKRDFGAMEDELLFGLEEKLTDEELEALEDKAEDAPFYAVMSTWFADKMKEHDAELLALEQQIAEDRVQLQIEAWLSTDKRDTPIHLEGYDTLEAGRIQLRDRFGLDLSEREREKLQAEFEASQRFAAEANAVLRKEKELIDALRAVLAEELVTLVDRGEALREQLSRARRRARVAEIKSAADAFFAEARDVAADVNLDQEVRDEVLALRATFDGWIDEELGGLGEVVRLVEDLQGLRDGWSTAGVTNILSIVDRTQRLLTDIESIELGTLVAGAEQALDAFFERMTGEGRAALTQLRSSDKGSALVTALEAAMGDLTDVGDYFKDVVAEVASIADQGKRGARTLTTIPESLRVDLDDLTDTSIELRRTGRIAGDSVRVRATRLKGGQELDTALADFELTRFGWHADLSAGVVLVQPAELQGGNEDYSFAPTLSWLHQYTPRPGDDSNWLNSIEPAGGLHAAFLNFDTADDESVQIGLGLTVSFWRGRLQFGYGYNMMADSRDDGQLYNFIGTDLIGLLQSAGVVR